MPRLPALPRTGQNEPGGHRANASGRPRVDPPNDRRKGQYGPVREKPSSTPAEPRQNSDDVAPVTHEKALRRIGTGVHGV